MYEKTPKATKKWRNLKPPGCTVSSTHAHTQRWSILRKTLKKIEKQNRKFEARTLLVKLMVTFSLFRLVDCDVSWNKWQSLGYLHSHTRRLSQDLVADFTEYFSKFQKCEIWTLLVKLAATIWSLYLLNCDVSFVPKRALISTLILKHWQKMSDLMVEFSRKINWKS